MPGDEVMRGPRELSEDFKREALREQANERKQKNYNRVLWLTVSIGVVVGGAGSAITGFAGSAEVAGAFGVLSTLAAGAERVFTPDAKRVLHGKLAAEAAALAGAIDIALARTGDPSEAELHEWVDRLCRIRGKTL